MRHKNELNQLRNLAKKSEENPVDFTNPRGERFIFEKGELVEYTDTKVINHEDNRLVNLAECPYIDE